MAPTELALILVTGLVAGVLGGLLGIGGSIIMIPALTALLGPAQHLYQAAAMVVNMAVAIPATLRHKKAGAIRRDVVVPMIPVALVSILAGVYFSDQMDGDTLRKVFAVFLAYVAIVNGWKLLRKADAKPQDGEHRAVPKVKTGFVAAVMGGTAGLLGIGGGIITVPLMQVILKLPLRQCIASTATVMCMSAPVGAAFKLYNLHAEHGDDENATATRALIIAASLIPTAIIGSRIGARLTHTLPVAWVRAVLTVLLILGALRMGDIIG
jgi:uncharacterized membrane protein YfcA